jgi:hypothetical protein
MHCLPSVTSLFPAKVTTPGFPCGDLRVCQLSIRSGCSLEPGWTVEIRPRVTTHRGGKPHVTANYVRVPQGAPGQCSNPSPHCLTALIHAALRLSQGKSVQIHEAGTAAALQQPWTMPITHSLHRRLQKPCVPVPNVQPNGSASLHRAQRNVDHTQHPLIHPHCATAKSVNSSTRSH